ncbi:MAG: hypothetical protein F6J96_07350 [Symploca sp. SIO1C2]|nr:hypothetical protein [Symploca sp. SIO1C2]
MKKISYSKDVDALRSFPMTGKMPVPQEVLKLTETDSRSELAASVRL